MVLPLNTTASRCAILAATGMCAVGLVSMPAAAADLGGNCCADLEDRIAELEATTVRKGNRKVTVKLSGQVNRMVMYWDDGGESNIYSVDNVESSTRFRFTGGAKWKPGWSVNYLIELEVESARSSSVDQIDDDRPNQGDGAIEGRKMAMNIKSDKHGTLWWGRYSPVTDDIILVDLGGTGAASSADVSNIGSGFFLRDSNPNGTAAIAGTGSLLTGAGTLGGAAFRWGSLIPGLDTARRDGLRYDSPSIHGFVLSAFWGEDDFWDIGVHFAKEWNSVRFAFGLGYLQDSDDEPDLQFEDGDQDQSEFKGSASILHMPTGLFLTGAWLTRSFDGTGSQDIQPFAVSRAGVAAAGRQRPDFDYWFVKGGIRRGFFSAGDTSIFVDYGEGEDALVGAGGFGCSTCSGNDIDEITKSDFEAWGVGVVQYINSAATELWINYRHYDADVAGFDAATGLIESAPLEDLDIVHVGGRIKF